MAALSRAQQLQAAIDYLDAIQVAPERFAWRGPEFESYVVATVDTLLRSDYSEWVAAIKDDDPVIIMPEWWTPQQQFACRNRIGSISVVGTKDYVQEHRMYALGDGPILTVDLDTGEEIPAP